MIAFAGAKLANTLAELQRDVARLGFVVRQIREIEEARQKRLEQQHETGPHVVVRLLARIVGVGVETADMLVHEVLSRPMRDRRAVARYKGLTGSPDESGAQRREQGLARAGNALVRRGMIQLAWRFLMFQKDSAPAESPAKSVARGPTSALDPQCGGAKSRLPITLTGRYLPPQITSRSRLFPQPARSGGVTVDTSFGAVVK
jgi:transposase